MTARISKQRQINFLFTMFYKSNKYDSCNSIWAFLMMVHCLLFTFVCNSYSKELSSIFAIYDPYSVDRNNQIQSGKNVFGAVPGYDSWTIDRIDRDLSRFTDCGLDGVILCIQPSDLIDSNKQSMIRNFLEFSSEKPNFFVSLLFSPNKRTELQLRNVSSFLTRKGFLNFKCSYKFKDKFVVFLSENIKISGNTPDDFIFPILTINPNDIQINTLEIPLLERNPLPLDSHQIDPLFSYVQVFAGLLCSDLENNVKHPWIVNRNKGNLFKKALTTAFSLNKDLIIISSWNNYNQGSAIENNTLDGLTMTNVIKSLKAQEAIKSSAE